MDGVPTLQRYLIRKTVTDCCESYSRVKYHTNELGYRTFPIRDENDNLQYYCSECGEDCGVKELVWMTHKQISKGCYRPLPEPILVSQFIFEQMKKQIVFGNNL